MALQMRVRAHSSPDGWCELIHRRCGLTIREAQVPIVIQSVRAHVEAAGLSERAYYEQLATAPDGDPEWTALVEQLVNHETSFFRHPPSFDALRNRLLPDLRAARGRTRLNLLSAGCSTGQEAYSLAMVARDQDPKGDFMVWGCDISRLAIDLARGARFGRRAVAGVPEGYRHFLTPSSGATEGAGGLQEFEIAEELTRRVRFSVVNLFAADGGITLSYDVIFCQNVLIYMSAPAVSQIVANLAARLVPGGYLVLGPGEGPSERPALLESVPVAGVRMFRRRNHTHLEGRS